MKKPKFQPCPRFRALFTSALLLVVLGFANTIHAADVLDASLKVRFNFDAEPVADVIADTSPAANHPGTNSLAAWTASEAGRTGVMRFDAEWESQITLAPAADLNSPVGSITFWMKSDLVTPTPNPYAVIFDRRQAGGDLIYQDPTGRIASQAQQASGGGANSKVTTASLTDDQWHHIAYVYDQAPSGSVSIYVDGSLNASGPNDLAWSWNPEQQIEIGKSHASFWSAYTGFLDDFRIYDRQLTAQEVIAVSGLNPTARVVIARQPQSITTGEQDSPIFRVQATAFSGDPAQLRYQWLRSDGAAYAEIPNATNSTYSFTVASGDTGKKYRVRVTLPSAEPVLSDEATLTVVPALTLHYNFAAEPAGDVIADASTGATKHDGQNLGATWVATETGRSGVMNFDGATPSQIIIPAAPEFNLKRGTIAFWMKSQAVTDAPNGYAMLVDRRTQTGNVIYQAPSGKLADQIAGGNQQTTEANLTNNVWRHVAYVYDQEIGGSVSFYVDGVLDTTTVNSTAWSWPADQQIEIGDSHDAFWAGFTGFLDDFRIYNRVLAPAEIAALAGVGPQPQITISRHPANLTVGVNDTPTLGVTARAVNGVTANLAYQWQRGGVDIAGATSSNYTFTATAADSGQQFRVRISYPGAATTNSTVATLTVLPEFVLHFPFDAAPQGDVVLDASPGGNNGLNGGGIWAATEDGRAGVMRFDPDAPSQIIVNAATNLNSHRGTIAFWMKSPRTTLLPNPYAMVFDRRAMPGDGVPLTGGDVLFQLPSGHLSDQAEIAGRARANAFSAAKNTTDGKWHHVAFAYDQTSQGFVSFYVDGVLDGTRKNNFAWYWPPEQQIEIGKSHDAYWSAYGGFLDEFRIYNRVLATNEIAALAGLAIDVFPKLQIALSGQNVILTWTGTGFVLQEKSDLRSPGGWTTVSGANPNASAQTIPLGTGTKFYRLSRP